MSDHEDGIEPHSIDARARDEKSARARDEKGATARDEKGATARDKESAITREEEVSGESLEADPNQILFEDLGEMIEGPSLPFVAAAHAKPQGSNPLFNSPNTSAAESGIPGGALVRPWSLNLEFEESVTDSSLDSVLETASGSDQLEWESAVSAEEPGTIMPTEDEADLALSDEGLKQEIRNVPDRMAFKIGDVAHIVGVKTYVLRYWETEFEALKPKKSKFNQRMYARRDVEILLMIKKLLYNDRFSIEGARLALRRLRKEVRADRQWDTVNGRIDQARERLDDLLGDIREMKDLFF